jgi:hypothetical protein
MFRNSLRLFALAMLGTSGPCSGADYSFFFTVSNTVSPDSPSATVTLWAAFPQFKYAFAKSSTEVWGDPDPGGFGDPTVLMEQGDYCEAGFVSPDGDSILGIRLLQLQFIGGEFADTANPLKVWSATWATDDFTPRTVPVETRSSDFWVYSDAAGGADDFYHADFSEAHEFIQVVPSPAGAGVLVGAGLCGRRRPRRVGDA